MRVLIIGDIHGNLEILKKILEKEKPEILISNGDWGSGKDLSSEEFKLFVKETEIPIITVFGNHDNLEVIRSLKDRNFHWLPNFIPREVKGFRFLGINGNIASRCKFPWHITEEIIREELRLYKFAVRKRITFLISHEAPKGFSDIIYSRKKNKNGKPIWKKHAGYEALSEVLKEIKPRYHVCGHLHFQAVSRYRNSLILNPGYGVKGNYILLDTSKNYKEKIEIEALCRKIHL